MRHSIFCVNQLFVEDDVTTDFDFSSSRYPESIGFLGQAIADNVALDALGFKLLSFAFWYVYNCGASCGAKHF